MSQEPTITMKELNSYIIEVINQLSSTKKQPNENTIFNLLLEKLEAIAINKEQLTERLNYLVEIKVLQNKPRNGVNSFYITNIESESSESPLIQTFSDTPKIKDFSKTKLNDNDKSSDLAENKNYMCDNQVYDLTTEIEAIKMFIKEQFYVIKKSIADISNHSEQQNNKEIIELLQEQNKLLIEENKSKTTIIEMLVESQNKSRNDQKSTEKFEVVKHRKYCKPRSIENEQINCQNRYETLYTDGNDEESENSSDSFTSSSEETPDNTPKQVRSRISKKKRLKNKSTVTVD